MFRWNLRFSPIVLRPMPSHRQRAWGELVERMQAEYERQLEEAAAIRELCPSELVCD